MAGAGILPPHAVAQLCSIIRILYRRWRRVSPAGTVPGPPVLLPPDGMTKPAGVWFDVSQLVGRYPLVINRGIAISQKARYNIWLISLYCVLHNLSYRILLLPAGFINLRISDPL
jgi:hypothetical protein